MTDAADRNDELEGRLSRLSIAAGGFIEVSTSFVLVAAPEVTWGDLLVVAWTWAGSDGKFGSDDKSMTSSLVSSVVTEAA